MLFGKNNASKAKDFGKALALFYIERIPREDQVKEKKFALKAQKALAKMQVDILRFKAENRLNIYQKAQIGNTFKWELKGAGFDPAYVEKLTEWLMLQVS